jgi:hypothetical protein
MLLRVEEMVNLEFESIDIIPGESRCFAFCFVLFYIIDSERPA